MPSVMAVGDLLVQLGAVTRPQLAAANEAGPNLDAFLGRLAGLAAHWDPDEPALTKYQQAQVRKCYPDQLDRLRAALKVHNYLVLSKLGQGGMGVVYKGVDPATGELFALKKIRTDSPNARRDLRREFEAMQQLKENPAVVQAVALLSAGKSEVLVMEYQNLGDLSEHIRRVPMRWREVVRWAATLLEGLDAAHRRGMIHRDIKPQNVMVHRTADRELVRLSDWGLVKSRAAVETQATVAGTIRGTFDYMPPEQWKGTQHVVAASDLYALGGTIYFALTHRPPFPVDSAGDMFALCTAHTQRNRPRARDICPDVPEKLDRLLQKMMHKEHAERGTAGELRREFLALLHPGTEEVTLVPAPPPPPAPPRAYDRPTTATGAASPTKSAPPRVPYVPPRPRTAARLETPSDREAMRRSGVPLTAAAARLARGLGHWGRQRGRDDHAAGMAARELRESWLVFRQSAAPWLDPRQSAARFALTASLALAVVGLLVWAARR